MRRPPSGLVRAYGWGLFPVGALKTREAGTEEAMVRYLVLGSAFLLAGCGGDGAVAWPAVTTVPAPATTLGTEGVALESTTSIPPPVDDALCQLLVGVEDTLAHPDMDDVEVLQVLRFGTEFFAVAAADAPVEIRSDMETVGHNREVLANGFESGLIERSLLEEDSLSFPGVDAGARQRLAEYVESHCPGVPPLGTLWEQGSTP